MSEFFTLQVFAVEPQRMCGQMIQNYVNHNGLASKVKVIAKKSDNITAEDLDHMKVSWAIFMENKNQFIPESSYL